MNASLKMNNIREAIDTMANAQQDAAFLISAETGESVSFRQLRKQSISLSGALRALGLGLGDKVAFLMDNELVSAQLFLGTIYGGYVAVPLNVRAGAVQLAYMLDHCDPKAVFVAPQYNEILQEAVGAGKRDVQIVEVNADGSLPVSDLAEEDLFTLSSTGSDVALLMYSSGSTGKPKGAIHTHKSILAHGRNSIEAHQLTSSDRSLLVLPLYHINAECVTLVPTLLSGGSVLVARRFAVSKFWDWIDDFQVTWSALVPTIISELVDWEDPGKERRKAALERIRFFRSSSAPLAPSLHQQFLDKFKLPLIQAMGSTEAGNVFSNPVPPGKNKIGSPGLPWGFETRIVDREGLDVPRGESGEVLLRGSGLMSGYYKDPEGTSTILDSEGWVHTGDLARQDEDGYFFVVGRSKELIIKGGVNIAPRQIDEILESHPAVMEAAAVGVPDRYFGEDVVAFVVLRNELASDENELLAYCEAHLGHFKTPSRIHFLKELPKGPSGKVQRLRLLDPSVLTNVATSKQLKGNTGTVDQPGEQTVEFPSETAGSIEQILSTAWAEVLAKPEIDPEDNFFAVGGHSLLAIQCLSKLREKLPILLSLADFIETGTIAKQSELIRKRLRVENPQNYQNQATESGQWEETVLKEYVPISEEPIPHLDPSVPHPLSPAQQRLWFMESLNPHVPVYNEAEAVLLTGELNVDALERALNLIVERHEILRSTITTIEDVPHAVIHERWPLRIKHIDLSEMPQASRQSEVERLLVDEPRELYKLESEPGIRVTLVKLSSREHALILMMHHIICDWSSEGIIWRDLSAMYASLLSGEPIELPSLLINHADYAAWQKRKVDSASFAEDLDYWEQELKGAPALLELPADRPRPPKFSHRGGRLRKKLTAELTEALRNTGRQEKTSLFTIFAAALDTVLYRYTGSDDILLGIPLADRDQQELQSIVGFLLHTHVLRTRLTGEMSFRELVARVQKAVVDLYTHRSAPFDQVVRRLQPERNLSYSPLFQVMLNWRDREQQLPFIGLEGLAIESLMAHSNASKFDLYLFVTDNGADISMELEYSTDLFDEDRMARLLGHYQTVLEAAATTPGASISELPLLTAEEYRQVVVDWNQTEESYPENKCLDELIAEQVERTPDAIAVTYEGKHLTYRELAKRSDDLADYLQEQGVGRNTVVAICVERSLEMVVGLLGILKTGAAYLPLDPTFPVNRLEFMLQDAKPRVLLTQERLVVALRLQHERVVSLESVSSERSPLKEQPGRRADDLAYILYTSGSSGTPKGVQIPHRAVVNFLLSMQREPGISARDTMLAITTLSFDIAGLELYLPLITGAQLVIASSDVTRDGSQLAELMRSSGATVMQATPQTWRLLLDVGWKGDPKLKILCGGEAWDEELADNLLKRCECLWNMYGPTETTIWSAVSCVKEDRPVLIGPPIANTSFYVLDVHGQPLPFGVPGELYIGGHGLAKGYLGRVELTQDRFVPDTFDSKPGAKMYRTGDLVLRTPDGNIKFLRRIDNQIKLRGFRIELGEIEAVLRQCNGVREAAAVLRSGIDGDKQLVGFYTTGTELNSDQVDPDAGSLRSYLSTKLPSYMIPGVLVKIDSMPHTLNGKVDRNALNHYNYELQERVPSLAPISLCGAMELKLYEIWQNILGVQRIAREDSFFGLGGHSLLALKMVQEVNKRLETDLRIAEFFQNPTIAGVMKVVRTNSKEASRLITLRPGISTGQIYFIDAHAGTCRLAESFDAGPALFATDVQADLGVVKAAVENRREDLPTLEDLAQPHADLILRKQADGPCVLVGNSFGGLLAFEVARQIHSRGRRVNAVVLLDATAQMSLSYRLRHITISRIISSFTWRVKQAKNLVAAELKGNLSSSERSAALGAELEGYQGALSNLPWDVYHRITTAAYNRYRCRRNAGMGILIRAKDEPRYLHFHTMGWDGLFTDGLEIIDARGDHMSLLAPENVSALSKAIQKSLSRFMTFELYEVLAH